MNSKIGKLALNCAVGFACGAVFLCGHLLAAGKQGLAQVPDRAEAQSAQRLPQVIAYTESLSKARAQKPFVLRLSGLLAREQQEAQEIALTDARFTEHALTRSGAPLRAEVLGVYPLRASEVTGDAMKSCTTDDACFRVDAFNFATGDGYTATVNHSRKQVLAVNRMTGIAPEISARLHRVALDIASASPLVAKTLGRKPQESDFVMANTRSTLAQSRCERSGHLCVAPTIVEGNSALFVIVDLTEFRVVGVRWTKLGRATPAPTQRRVQNEAIARDFCERATPIERDGWTFNFQITSSDGVRVGDVAFKGKALYKSIKTVDWHVNYAWKDRMGYSDAVGCPMFSQAAVVAMDPPEFVDLIENGQRVGFSLVQDFRSDQWPRPCNYFYRQRFDFFIDGRLRPANASFGRGCGDDATYRPVTRIEFAQDARAQERSATQWTPITQEIWRESNKIPTAQNGASFRFLQLNATIDVVPNRGGFEGSRGDNALIYITAHPAGRDEGASDLPPIGTCCNTDHRQGPEKFMNPPESLASATPLVLWYVAALKNDATPGKEYCWADFVLNNGVYEPKAFPCYAGPMLIPGTAQ